MHAEAVEIFTGLSPSDRQPESGILREHVPLDGAEVAQDVAEGESALAVHGLFMPARTIQLTGSTLSAEFRSM